jgi:hypothetical protein
MPFLSNADRTWWEPEAPMPVAQVRAGVVLPRGPNPAQSSWSPNILDSLGVPGESLTSSLSRNAGGMGGVAFAAVALPIPLPPDPFKDNAEMLKAAKGSKAKIKAWVEAKLMETNQLGMRFSDDLGSGKATSNSTAEEVFLKARFLDLILIELTDALAAVLGDADGRGDGKLDAAGSEVMWFLFAYMQCFYSIDDILIKLRAMAMEWGNNGKPNSDTGKKIDKYAGKVDGAKVKAGK